MYRSYDEMYDIKTPDDATYIIKQTCKAANSIIDNLSNELFEIEDESDIEETIKILKNIINELSSLLDTDDLTDARNLLRSLPDPDREHDERGI